MQDQVCCSLVHVSVHSSYAPTALCKNAGTALTKEEGALETAWLSHWRLHIRRFEGVIRGDRGLVSRDKENVAHSNKKQHRKQCRNSSGRTGQLGDKLALMSFSSGMQLPEMLWWKVSQGFIFNSKAKERWQPHHQSSFCTQHCQEKHAFPLPLSWILPP